MGIAEKETVEIGPDAYDLEAQARLMLDGGLAAERLLHGAVDLPDGEDGDSPRLVVEATPKDRDVVQVVPRPPRGAKGQ